MISTASASPPAVSTNGASSTQHSDPPPYTERRATCRVKVWQLDETTGSWSLEHDWKVRRMPFLRLSVLLTSSCLPAGARRRDLKSELGAPRVRHDPRHRVLRPHSQGLGAGLRRRPGRGRRRVVQRVRLALGGARDARRRQGHRACRRVRPVPLWLEAGAYLIPRACLCPRTKDGCD